MNLHQSSVKRVKMYSKRTNINFSHEFVCLNEYYSSNIIDWWSAIYVIIKNERIKYDFWFINWLSKLSNSAPICPKTQNARLCYPNNKNDEMICKISLNVINQHFTCKLSNFQRSFRLLFLINQGYQWFGPNDQKQL